MLDNGHPAPLVSVIVPVFNGEAFLGRCLDSIFAQTEQRLEVIVVNDGSTDQTRQILAEQEALEPRLLVVDQENAGQGAARNRALDMARGDYVLFVDADDFIERVTLQVTTERAEADGSDIVHFDWKLYTPGVGRPGDMHYYNADPFWHKRTLEGVECDELLRVQNFYSVTKLYRRSFLNEHQIRFEEGRIYEDNPFVVQTVNRAQRASLVHSPLYTIDPHPDSSTRSHTDTDKHVHDHLYAVRRTFEVLDRRNPRAAAYLAAYHIKKIGPYYEKRIPRRYRRAYIREFVEILHRAQVEIPAETSTNAPTRMAVRLRMLERNRANLFQAMVAGKNIVMPRYKKLKRWAKRMRNRSNSASAWSASMEKALAQPVLKGTMTFLGLDFKYSGNSRYLYESVLSDPRFAGYDIRFVTTDERVAAEVRLDPGAPETYRHLARTELVIAESWIPPRVRKHPDSTWVQLWHGTPLKRMLFDSHEPRIIWNRRHHKTNKYRDILNWDYLVVDSPEAADLFATAFLMAPEKLICSGYPRVSYLIESATNEHGRGEARRTLNNAICDEDTVVLYAPTWRDMNYGREQSDGDFSYTLDVASLAEQLGPSYRVVYHDHGYLSSNITPGNDSCIDASGIDIQELILAADVVITDYSSLVFDAFAVQKPVVFFSPDFEAFEANRGVYAGMWRRYAVRNSTSTLQGVLEAVRAAGPVAPVQPRFESVLADRLLSLMSDSRAEGPRIVSNPTQTLATAESQRHE